MYIQTHSNSHLLAVLSHESAYEHVFGQWIEVKAVGGRAYSTQTSSCGWLGVWSRKPFCCEAKVQTLKSQSYVSSLEKVDPVFSTQISLC